jgi:transcription-repair coupling factor (superfamily II helicase)
VSNIDVLSGLYAKDRSVAEINTLTSGEIAEKIQLDGLLGASDCFILAGCFLNSRKPQIYIASDKEEAAYILNTLQAILENKTIHFFPDSFKRPLQYDELDKNNVLLRTEAINKIHLVKGKSQILVTYPEAIFEKAVDPAILDKDKIEVNKNADLDVNTMIELLVMYGFERVEFVYQPGQFSIRGGIIDIFSYGNEWPYRIELFDTEVESIRTFNPINQLSVSNISQVSIIPNINNKFKQDQKVSIFSVFSKETNIWIKEPDLID